MPSSGCVFVWARRTISFGLAAGLVACSSAPGGPSDEPAAASGLVAENEGQLGDGPIGKGQGERGSESGTSTPNKGRNGESNGVKTGGRSQGDTSDGERSGGNGANNSDNTPGQDGPTSKKRGRKSSVVSDLRNDFDAEGNPPSYVDLTGASIHARGPEAIITLEFASALPRSMPNEEHAVLAGIDVEDAKRRDFIYAEGTSEGWRPDRSGRRFVGEFSVQGRHMTFTVALSTLSRRNRFEWYAHSSWTRSTLTETDYSFDVAPDDQSVYFPQDVHPR